MVIDLNFINKSIGKQTELHLERFPGATVIPGFPSDKDIDDFLIDLDVVFTIETPYNYYLFKRARELGVKTVLNYNYEFLDYLQHPDWEYPDMLLAPSQWNLREVIQQFESKAIVKFIPVPVNRDVLPYENRRKAQTFIHIAGHQTHMSRNGTDILIASLPHITDKHIRILIYTQHELPVITDSRVQVIHTDNKNYWDNFTKGDVLILPRKYGGLSLQLNEALSRGIVPLMPRISPQDGFLQSAMLMPTERAFRIQTRTAIDCFEVAPQVLAEYIDNMADMNEKDFSELSKQAGDLGVYWGWNSLRAKYINTLTKLCRK
ncbi:hypothetical protein [Polynucleobacter sp.]|uniref:hypothetical protein n=1 Tax=Polynucleobacter sp. TaxID=2029855 RepID=UPI003F6A1059